MAKKPSDKGSTKSSTKSVKSLASKATTALKSIKRKATIILSPKKSKKAKHARRVDSPDVNSSQQSASHAPSTAPPSEQPSNHSQPSVVEVSDDDEAAMEASDEELGK